VQVATSNEPESQIGPEILENPESAYMVGRGLLQADNSEAQALAFLQRAALLEPQNPEFAYWEGVGHWANGDKEGERRSYLRGLGADPQSVPLLINLGHNYLSDKNYQEALEAYQAVLALSPDEPVALYNSGLIYRTLGMTSDEISSWQGYLQRNRQGAKASRAIKRLHGYGDYTFRSYRIGEQTVIVNQQRLLDDYEPAESQHAEFADIVSALDEDQWLNLEIVVFIENDREAAMERALNMKKMISTLSSSDVNRRVGVSWFDVPETIQSADTDQSVILSEGMLLFTHLKTETDRETSI
jgi:tetratricopeptide (TPR) repeat protein